MILLDDRTGPSRPPVLSRHPELVALPLVGCVLAGAA